MLITAMSMLAQAMAAPTTYINPGLGGATPPTPGGRSCYGCIGLCTYTETPHACFANQTYGAAPAGLKWYDVEADLGKQGRGWPSNEMWESKYTRLPAKATAIVDGTVLSLAQMSAGLKARFYTKAQGV